MKTTTVLFLVSLSVWAVTHQLLLKFFLYWRYPEIDVPMHFFGGMIFALGVFAARDLRIPLFAHLTKSYRTVLFVFCIAMSWEFFEYFGGMSDITYAGFTFDSLSDLVLGVLGSVVGLYVARNVNKLDT